MRKISLTFKFGICDRKIDVDNEEFSITFSSEEIDDKEALKLVRFLTSDLHYYFIEKIKNKKV